MRVNTPRIVPNGMNMHSRHNDEGKLVMPAARQSPATEKYEDGKSESYHHEENSKADQKPPQKLRPG